MTCCSGFWMWAGSLGLLWWLFSSLIVYYTWNHVITAVTSAKSMRFRHALLLVFAIACLHAPHHVSNGWKGGCSKMQMNMMDDRMNDHDADDMPEMKLELRPSK